MAVFTFLPPEAEEKSMIVMKTISRSSFLRTAGSAMVALCMSPLTGMAARNVGDGLLHASSFEPLLQSQFTIRSKENSMAARLIKVKDRSHHFTKKSQPVNLETFSLLFQTEPGVELESNTHRVTHPQLGTISLFISPTKVNGEEGYCEAVINRIVR